MPLEQCKEWILTHLAMVLVGFSVGAGNALIAQSPVPVVIGKALTTAGLSVGAGGLLLLFADPHPLILLGLSGIVASLGMDALQRFLWSKIEVQIRPDDIRDE